MDPSKIPDTGIEEQLTMLPEYAEYSMSLVKPMEKSEKICIFASGQSSIAAEIISAYSNECSKIQIQLIQDSRVPLWISDDTDVILISYSGNNKVINDVYPEVIKRNCRIHCIASGGKLETLCKKNSVDFYKIPDKMTPMSATGFIFGILVSIIQEMGVCDIRDSFMKMIPELKTYRDNIVRSSYNPSDYRYLLNDSICVYGTSDIRPLYRRYKLDANEILNRRSFCAELPEFNHNELVGWSMTKTDMSSCSLILMRSKTYNLLSTIVDNTIETLKEYGADVITVDVPGDDVLQKNLKGIMFIDILSVKLSKEAE